MTISGVDIFQGGLLLSGIQCPYCRSAVALDRIGVHFQKFCSAIQTESAREASMKKFNQFYMHLQSHSRGEINTEELQAEANNLFRQK
jgi:hypothetical protein